MATTMAVNMTFEHGHVFEIELVRQLRRVAEAGDLQHVAEAEADQQRRSGTHRSG